MNFQMGTANVTFGGAAFAQPEGGVYGLFPFQTALGAEWSILPGPQTPVGKLRFDRATIAQFQGEPLASQDPLGFNYQRMVAGEASAAAGRHRPLTDVMNELRARHR